MEDEFCECDEHGRQPIAFVCNHICSVPSPQTVGFVSFQEGPDDLRDAWCDACDDYLQAHGGEWIDDRVEVPGGIVIICAACYRARERDAVSAGRRAIYSN